MEPPGNIAFFLTIDLTTHKASCKDLSVSSSTSWIDPLHKIETVYELFGTPVISTIFDPSDKVTSSHFASVPNFSLVNGSILKFCK